jgi:hypothetical protein
MESGDGKVVVVVRPGTRTATVLVWLRQLVPAAILLVAPASLPPGDLADDDPIVIEADDIDSPMSLADALAKGHVGAARG